MDVVWGFLVDISGNWGIRKMLKLMKRSLLPHIVKRVSFRIPDKGHFLHDGDINRLIEFIAIVNNPTPLNITLFSREIDVLHEYVVIASISNCNETEICREVKESHIAIEIYNPLLYPMGLPTKNEQWSIRGKLRLRCPYGEFDYDIPESNLFCVSGDWNKALEHVARVKGGLLNDAET